EAIVPPIHRATTICQAGTGDIHVNVNDPERTSAPSTASPITRQVTGITRPKRPTAATPANARTSGSLLVVAMNPNSREAAAGTRAPTHRRAGRQDRRV